jgi:hypothetical protein
MTTVLGWLDKEYGSTVDYLTAHGLLPESVVELREKLVG